VSNVYGIDNKQLLKKLVEGGASSGTQSKQSKSKHKNILAGINGKSYNVDESSRHEDMSIDQFSGGVDFLMDENILTNESREEDEGRAVRTPNNNLKN